MDIKNVSVIGAGQMGTQIAMNAALSGYEVYCYSRKPETVAKAIGFADNWFKKSIAKGKMDETAVEEVKERLKFTSDVKIAAQDADLIIETVADQEDVKRKVLAQVDEYAKEDAIYASNSSYIVSSRFCDVVRHPERVLNLHYFNPALVMKVVEVVKGPHTSQEVVDIVYEFSKTLGKSPVLVNKEIYGFIVNRIFSALTREACYLVDAGIASVEDIDTAVKGGLGHPMGPLELLDMTGIDLEYTVYMEKFRNSGDKTDLPAACLTERYARGEYGKKSKKGFYTYE